MPLSDAAITLLGPSHGGAEMKRFESFKGPECDLLWVRGSRTQEMTQVRRQRGFI